MSTGRAAAPCLAALLALSPGGCADDESAACPGLRDEDCSIGEASCQQQIFAATACLRGQPDAQLPAIRTITREEYAEELRAQAAPEDDYGVRVWGSALGLFGLVPEAQSIQEADVAQRVATVAAFYRRDTRGVTIIADTANSPRSARLTLSHEFVHALQDQREGLQPFYDAHATNSDANAALKCLTEGEAVFLSNLTVLHFEGTGLDEVNWERYFGSWLEHELADVGAAEAPLLATRSLVYPVGGAGVLRTYQEAGLSGIGRFYTAPAHTFRYWADDRAGAPDAEPLDCNTPAAPDAFALKYHDRHGLPGLLSLYVGLGEGVRYEAARQWRSDAFLVYSDPNEVSDAVVVAWRLRLASEDDAAQLAEAVTRSGRAIQVRSAGREVLLTAATDPALLEGWDAADRCNSSDKARHPATSVAPPGPASWPRVDMLH
jgi:hypothetical protein